MKFTDVEELLKQGADSSQVMAMEAYMKHQFPFLGIRSPQRRQISKIYFKEHAHYGIDWAFVREAWASPYRESQYVAIDYLITKKKELQLSDLDILKELALDKPWWDSIDGLDELVGKIVQLFPEAKQAMREWSVADSMWLRRIAINHQLLMKDKTDPQLLEDILVANLGQKEFFINKAIGWSLRDYAKTNPTWVKNFLHQYADDLAPLSIREASKHLD